MNDLSKKHPNCRFATVILVLVLLILGLANAQSSPPVAWAVKYDGGGSDSAYGVVVDSSDNVIVTGGSDGDYYTIKYDSSGNQLWAVRYDSGGSDCAYGVAVDSSDNVIVTGASDGDYYTIKYDSSGNQLWAVSYDSGFNASDRAYGVAVDSGDNVIVIGDSYFGGYQYDYNTIKYDSGGNQLWTVSYDSGGEEFMGGVAIDSSDNVIVTGTTNPPAGMGDYYTIKYDPIGNQLLAVRYNGGHNDQAHGVAVDSSDNVIVTGESYNYPGVYYDYYTIKYDSSGNQLWAVRYDGGSDGHTYGVAVDSSDNVIVTGYSESEWQYDYYTIKYDPSGNELLAVRYDGGELDMACGVAVDSSNNVIVTGRSNLGGQYDYYTIKYVTAEGRVIYVDPQAIGGNDDGSSWVDAYRCLQDALANASSGDEIRVADGVCKPDVGRVPILPGREATFQLKNGVALYGGFAGYGASDPDARDIGAYETILSGDLNGDDGPDFTNNGENSYHVVTGSGTDATARLDGFTITAGNSNDPGFYLPSPHSHGGGMYNYSGSPTVTNCTFSGNIATGASGAGGMFNYYSSPAVTNCTFSGNSAGMYNYNSSATLTNCTFSGNSSDAYGGGMTNTAYSSPTLTNCTFSGNSSDYFGGGMANNFSSPTLTNCTFSGNSAEYDGGGMHNTRSNTTVINCTFRGNSAGRNGGGMYNNFESEPTVVNCTFTGNSTEQREGGGMYNDNSSPTLTNCTFIGNSASATYGGGGMFYWNSSNPTLTNCIMWGDTPDEVWGGYGGYPVITYSDVQGGTGRFWFGAGCIDTDPMFADGDGRLSSGSPCIDAGNNTAVPPDTTDLDGDGDTAEPIPFDLDGNPRIINGIVDMGAYEVPFGPPSGLVSWWPGDGHADDIVGENHGTLVNGATYAHGKVGQAFSFDGVDDYVEIPYDRSFNLSSFTLQAWVKFTQRNAIACIISRPSGGNPIDGYSFFKLSNAWGRIAGGVQGEGQYYSSSVSTGFTTFADDNWHMCSFVRDVQANEISIYVDSVFYMSYPDSSPGDMEHNYKGITIGSCEGSRDFFEGLIDEVTIYNRALTADEIQAIFLAASAGE